MEITTTRDGAVISNTVQFTPEQEDKAMEVLAKLILDFAFDEGLLPVKP